MNFDLSEKLKKIDQVLKEKHQVLNQIEISDLEERYQVTEDNKHQANTKATNGKQNINNYEQQKTNSQYPATNNHSQYATNNNNNNQYSSTTNNFINNNNNNHSSVPDKSKNKAMQQYENDIKKKEKEKVLNTLRKSGTEMWQDESLNDWPPGDFRIFVGDLGNEVNDEHLATAFRKYLSFNKAKVVRCKKSNKSRGYGFVSLMDPQDYLKALKEMSGKYIGNRPIKVKASEWQKRGYEKNKNKFKDSKIKFIKKKIIKK